MKRNCVYALLLLAPVSALAVDWKPVNSDELGLKTPKIDKNADAEAIFWDVRIYDVLKGDYADHYVDNYVRIKVFNDRGVKSQSTVDIPYTNVVKMSISDLRARTIKPDGSIVVMKNDAIFDKTDAKIGRRTHFKTRSFTLPAVEPGSIVEYQWKETYSETPFRHVELKMYRDIPIWQVTYLVRPLVSDRFPFKMSSYNFNCRPAPGNQFKSRSILQKPL